VEEHKFGIIIQARLGSTRLPNKITKPFSGDESILDIVIKKFKNNTFGFPVILATSENPKDAQLEHYANKHNIMFFRGEEHDVLKRFIDAAHFFRLNQIVRVCADNPFLDLKGFESLVNERKSAEGIDYIAFRNDFGVPSIKTHWGVFTEIVSVAALSRVVETTSESSYHEHVTNYIYGHPEEFDVKLVDAPPVIFKRDDIRLTIDTASDFETLQKLYADYLETNFNFTLETLVGFIDEQPVVKAIMVENIKRNSK
jgi:spore coat polysaccharide biosynthesis protein SpsF